MSECQTNAGNQEFQSWNVIENFENLKNVKCLCWSLGHAEQLRDAKRCERCEQCSCKDFPTGVKILVENVMKGGEKKFKCL